MHYSWKILTLVFSLLLVIGITVLLVLYFNESSKKSTCNSDTECQEGEKCVNGSCISSDLKCMNHSDCTGQNQFCDGKICRQYDLYQDGGLGPCILQTLAKGDPGEDPSKYVFPVDLSYQNSIQDCASAALQSNDCGENSYFGMTNFGECRCGKQGPVSGARGLTKPVTNNPCYNLPTRTKPPGCPQNQKQGPLISGQCYLSTAFKLQ